MRKLNSAPLHQRTSGIPNVVHDRWFAEQTVTREKASVLSQDAVMDKYLRTIAERIVQAFLPSEGFPDYLPPENLEAFLMSLSNRGLLNLQGIKKRDKFCESFVHECSRDIWGPSACESLVQLLQALDSLVTSSKPLTSWLQSHTMLLTMQHGDLNFANILVDVQNNIWLLDVRP